MLHAIRPPVIRSVCCMLLDCQLFGVGLHAIRPRVLWCGCCMLLDLSGLVWLLHAIRPQWFGLDVAGH